MSFYEISHHGLVKYLYTSVNKHYYIDSCHIFTLLQKCLKSIGSNRSQANAAEIKILIIIVYYILLSLYALTMSVVTFFETDSFIAKVKQYYLCEAHGITASTNCSKMSLDQFDSVSKVFANVLVGVYPVIFLMYIVQLKTCVAKFKKTLTTVSSYNFK